MKVGRLNLNSPFLKIEFTFVFIHLGIELPPNGIGGKLCHSLKVFEKNVHFIKICITPSSPLLSPPLLTFLKAITAFLEVFSSFLEVLSTSLEALS
jgi:hypothetical protein